MIVFIKADGTAINVAPSPVYQGSSLAGSLYLVAPFPPTNAVSVAFTLANGDYTTEYAMTGISALEGVTDKLGDGYSIWEWQTANGFVTQFAGTVTAQFKVSYNGQTVATSAINFTVQQGVQALPPTEPSADQWQELLELYSSLNGTVSELENVLLTDPPVLKIQKVAPNAFNYTNSKGITSAPIILEGTEGVPLAANQASTILIPQSAWQYVNESNASDGYKCIISAAMHGQMKNAVSQDLWVSFGEIIGETSDEKITDIVQSYTIDESGNITITAKQVVNLIVRVWNGKGDVGDMALSLNAIIPINEQPANGVNFEVQTTQFNRQPEIGESVMALPKYKTDVFMCRAKVREISGDVCQLTIDGESTLITGQMGAIQLIGALRDFVDIEILDYLDGSTPLDNHVGKIILVVSQPAQLPADASIHQGDIVKITRSTAATSAETAYCTGTSLGSIRGAPGASITEVNVITGAIVSEKTKNNQYRHLFKFGINENINPENWNVGFTFEVYSPQQDYFFNRVISTARISAFVKLCGNEFSASGWCTDNSGNLGIINDIRFVFVDGEGWRDIGMLKKYARSQSESVVNAALNLKVEEYVFEMKQQEQ